ncbi:hypothetical protein LRS06_05115 [Hymenobacter sp. J193]|uniref:hypothetical protein n=1 Tax=Hymenobacter sp. J193 TaxID=2898429 RepID=UPI00215133A2|nr:hypothetical protein [Hymenobacter sp. J193]MCR5887167.1 hypothetical protein [Hymenobacter sp. J193]
MGTSLLMLAAVVIGLLYQNLVQRIRELSRRLQQREDEHLHLVVTVERLRQELQQSPAPSLPPVAASAKPAPASPPTAQEWYRAPAAAEPPALATTAAATPAPLPVSPTPEPTPAVLSKASGPSADGVAKPPLPVSSSPATTSPATASPEAPKALPIPAVDKTAQSSPPPTLPPQPPRRSIPTPAIATPAEPTWWDRTEQLLLDNWTGILGAIVLVMGVGFLGVYTALRVSAPVRFGMITAFAAALLGLHYYLRPKPFAAQLHVWLQSSAAAVFLFACVGAVSVPGLQWAGPPWSYLLLLAGVAANLWLAWDASREAVATLHGVLSLVALAVLPDSLLTLAAAAGVTTFSIGITYRQRWKYQLLLSIISFFAFHQYWHHSLPEAPLSNSLRLGAMGLTLLVGVAAAFVQYRKVYANSRFDALLFAAHVLNWTCLGINLYQYSTGSPWKTIPLGLGALLTFGVARRARVLGIAWLFRTDSIISLALALFTAFSLQGWHASGSLILVFMLLETLLVAFIMARERETLVFQVASAGALLASGSLLLLNLIQLGTYPAVELHRNAFLLLLTGLLGAGYYQLIQQQTTDDENQPAAQQLYRSFGGMVSALYGGAAALLLRGLFGLPEPAVFSLTSSALAAAGAVFGVAWWLRSTPGWFRTLHLLGGQLLLTVSVLGLHKAGLSWPATATILYLETLLLAGALGRVGERVAYRTLLGAALLSGGWLLLAATQAFERMPQAVLYQNLLLLLLAGISSSVLLTLPTRLIQLTQLLATRTTQHLHATLQGLTVLFYLAGSFLLTHALFSWTHPPVAVLLSGATAAAGGLFALAWWLRGTPGWFRPAHLLLGQLLLMVAVLGLHEAGLSWPATSTLLYAEVLLMTLLLAWRAEWPVYRILLYLALIVGAVLPLLVYRQAELTDTARAGLLVAAALASLLTQVALIRRGAPVHDQAPLSYNPIYRLRLLSLLVGLQVLAAGGLVYGHTWAGWALAAIVGALFVVRRLGQVPGLWVGLVVATVGYQALQWSQVLPINPVSQPWSVVGYLLPLIVMPVIGAFCSWWEGRQQHVRWPWIYLGGLQLLLATWVSLAPRHQALPLLVWTLLAAGAILAAQLVRRRASTAPALTRAGLPDRFFLHLAYLLLAISLIGHFDLVVTHSSDKLLGVAAHRFTAGALLVLLGGWAWQRPPATGPQYNSWRYLHPLLPELGLLFGCFTVWHEIRVEWHSVLWLLGGFALTLAGRKLPLRLRRIHTYGLLFYGAAVLWSSYVALTLLAPGQLLTLAGLTTLATTIGLFAYAAVALPHFPSRLAATWPRLLKPLAALGRMPAAIMIPVLLYPAFGVLTLLLLQTFDRSILTVLLMLEVLAAFVSSLLLRRQDLRYVALAGTALCFGRLLLFDLRQHGTITRAVVFILMGMLLLGMNALYARFKSRFSPQPLDDEPEEDTSEENLADSLG